MLSTKVLHGDCLNVIDELADESVNVIITSPPYWGQRLSDGIGTENDPRIYIHELAKRLNACYRVLKSDGIMWINIGDAYNTPVNWSQKDFIYSSLGKDKCGLDANNSAYMKPRFNRKTFIDKTTNWLKYGNLLALPSRLLIHLCDSGWYYRGEIIWEKSNPMPEGRCRRPHRSHEIIYLFAKSEKHHFRVSPPIKSVWKLANEPKHKIKHFSRFPKDLPKQCLTSYGKFGPDIVVLDPFSGSATTGLAAVELGCSFIGVEIEQTLAEETNKMLQNITLNEV